MCIYLWFVESKDRWYWIHQFIKIICWYPSLPAFYDLLQTLFALFIKHDQTINKIFSWSYEWITLSDKISSDKIFLGQNISSEKFSTPSPNFDTFVQFLPDFCIEIFDEIFDGQYFSSDKLFDTKPKFGQFCPTKFCPIRYG